MKNTPNKGKFISIEGIDGAGKSTISKWIFKYLKEKNIDVILTREPGGTEIAEQIRNISFKNIDNLKNVNEPIYKETELLLMYAARVQHINYHILPALNKGTWVISDRFVDSTYAYQGNGRYIDTNLIDILTKYCVAKLPDITFLIDIDVDVALERNSKSGKHSNGHYLEGKIDVRKDFQINIDKGFKKRALEESERVKVINKGSMQAQQEQIKSYINSHINYQFDNRQLDMFD